MKKKIVSALLCVAMAASLVVGCGSKSGSDSGSSKGGDKLVYWAMWSEDEPQAGSWKYITADFCRIASDPWRVGCNPGCKETS